MEAPVNMAATRQKISPASSPQTPAQIASQGLPAEENDVNMLFEKYSIDEIRAIEKRTRQNIEKKKEDLRLMVGERYRDLIEAADTISEMNASSANVMNSIVQMQSNCKDLSESHLARGLAFNKNVAVMKKRKDVQFFSIAVQIKLLLDTPEKVWSAIDEGSFLRASQLYLLAKYVHTQLYTDPKLISKVDQMFPVLSRQWAAISHYKTTILNGCRAALKNTNISDKCICDSLCAIVLLEDNNPRQVFNEFLVARTNAVRHYFHPDQQISIKDQICEIVRLITKTVNQIYVLFYDGHDLLQDEKLREVNMVKQTLEAVTSQGSLEMLKSNDTCSLNHLPQSIRDFKPTVSATTLSIPKDEVQEKCQLWLESCSQGISSGIGKLLLYISTVKHLAAVRDDLWTMLVQDEHQTLWDERCQLVLNKTVNVWEDYFRQLFYSRIKTIIENQFSDSVDSLQRNLDSILNEMDLWKDSLRYEHDVSLYVWSEGPGDVAPGSGWTVARNRPITESGALLMKASAYTVSIQGLCKKFDGRVQSLLEDIHYYTEPSEQESVTATIQEAFDRGADAQPVYQVITNACDSNVISLLEHISKILAKCRDELENLPAGNDDEYKKIVDRALLCARLCSGLSKLCPGIKECMVTHEGKESRTPLNIRRRSSTPSKLQLKKTAEDPRFKALKQRLIDRSIESYKLWTDFASLRATRAFRETLANIDQDSVLRNSTRWDEIVIEEENEQGLTIQSTIRVPMQPSPYVHTLLYTICAEINRIGGHSLRRNTIEDLVEQLNLGCLTSYEHFLHIISDQKLSQNRALQHIFDLRFLSSLFQRKNERSPLQKQTQAIIESLESRIDPFDLDVFMPHVTTHLTKLQYRASVMYGALICPERSVPAPAARGSGVQEQHNTLSVGGGQQRFTLLPVNTQTRNQAASSPVTAQVMGKR